MAIAAPPAPRPLSRRIAGALPMAAFALLCAVIAGHAFAYLYLSHPTGNPFAARFAVSGLDVPVHFFAAGLALALAPLQLSRRLRAWSPRLHRLGGWLYAGAVLLGGLSGLSLASHAQGGAASGSGFAILALLWMATTACGIAHAVAGRHELHRRWMSRSVALSFSAVTLRLILGIGTGLLQLPLVAVYVAAAWLCWIVNLAVCEALLRRPASVQRRGPQRGAPSDAAADA
jgi:hypothetical protein